MADAGPEVPSEGTLRTVLVSLAENATNIGEAESRLQMLLQRRAALVQAQRLLQYAALTACLSSGKLAFQQGRPEAAMIVHRCLVQWRTLEMTDTATQAFLQGLIHAVRQELDDNHLNKQESLSDAGDGVAAAMDPSSSSSSTVLQLCAYWLAVTTTLLALVHRLVPEHASLGTGSKAAGTGRGMFHGDVAPLSAAATKITDIKNKLFTGFGNLLKRGGAATDHPTDALQPQETGGVHAVSSNGHAHTVDAGKQPQLASSLSTRPSLDSASAGSFTAQPTGVSDSSPAQAFHHSLNLLGLQSYSLVRDNIKRQLAPMLPACIQAPSPSPPLGHTTSGDEPAGPHTDTAEQQQADSAEQGTAEVSEFEARRLEPVDPAARFVLDDTESQDDVDVATPAVEKTEAVVQPVMEETKQAGGQGGAGLPTPTDTLQAWTAVVDALQSALHVLRAQCMPRILIKCLFKEILSFIDAQLFNQLLLRPECCCQSNARYVLDGLKVLDDWIVSGSSDAMMRPLFQELRHVRQAATFLVTPGKSGLSCEEITQQLCPALSNQQIYRLCTTYWDDGAANHVSTAAGASADDAHASTASTARQSEDTKVQAAANQSGSAVADVDDAVNTSGSETHTPQPRGASQLHMAPAAPAVELVNGDVLEQLKGVGAGAVQGNGGLIVMFLLDDDQTPIIAPEGPIAPEVLKLIEGRDLYTAALTLPAVFDTPDCPRQVFEFVEHPLPLPAGYASPQKSKGGGAA